MEFFVALLAFGFMLMGLTSLRDLKEGSKNFAATSFLAALFFAGMMLCFSMLIMAGVR